MGQSSGWRLQVWLPRAPMAHAHLLACWACARAHDAQQIHTCLGTATRPAVQHVCRCCWARRPSRGRAECKLGHSSHVSSAVNQN